MLARLTAMGGEVTVSWVRKANSEWVKPPRSEVEFFGNFFQKLFFSTEVVAIAYLVPMWLSAEWRICFYTDVRARNRINDEIGIEYSFDLKAFFVTTQTV